jgi:transcriptional regulator with XRE-family HTH domain
MNYGKAIKLARTIANMTQAELASEAGLDTSHISLIEHGKRRPSTRTLDKISHALQIPHHLMLLLGTEQKDLRGIRQSDLELVGQSLVHAIVKHENRDSKPAKRKRSRRTA